MSEPALLDDLLTFMIGGGAAAVIAAGCKAMWSWRAAEQHFRDDLLAIRRDTRDILTEWTPEPVSEQPTLPPTAAGFERAADDDWLARHRRLAAPDTPGSDA